MRRASIFAVLLATSCATTHQSASTAGSGASVSKPGSPAEVASVDDVGQLRERISAILKAQAELAFKSMALGESVDFSSAYQNREAVFSIETYRKVENLRAQEKDAERARALNYLKLYLGGEIVARSTADLGETLAAVVAGASVNVAGQEYGYLELDTLLAAEAHAGRRHKLWDAADIVVKKQNVVLLEREKRLANEVASLGYPNYLAFAIDLRQADLTSLVNLAQEVLQQTDAFYQTALGELARKELRMSLADLRRSDIFRLFRTGDVDSFFPQDKEVEKLKTALAGMGFDLAAMSQLKIDVEPRPRKNPRAFAVAVQPGRDVRLSLRPASGLTANAQLWHEAAYALRLASTGGEVMEYQWLGNNAASETYGFLFEGLLDNPAFAAQAGISEAKLAKHVRMSALRRLFALRQWAGRLLFEVAWRSSTAKENPAEMYRQAMSRAWGFAAEPRDGERYLVDSEDFLIAADRLRAMVAAFQLDAALSTSVGPQWWTNAKTQAQLTQLWKTGGRDTVEELVRSIGAKGLDVAPMVETMRNRLAAQ